MAYTKNNRATAYTSKQRVLLCNDVATNQSSQLQVLGYLAPNTEDELYESGDLLAKYGDNAPTADLVGFYVNYDPDSDNDDQKVCVAAISGEFVNGVTGVDATSADTIANTLNAVDVIEFSIGTTYYKQTLVDSNTTGQMTGFADTFVIKKITDVYLNDTLTEVDSIQGVA